MDNTQAPAADATTLASNVVPAQDAGNTASGTPNKDVAATTPKSGVVDQPVKDTAPAVDYAAEYKKLQRAYTQETQKRSALEKRWDTMEAKLDEQAKHLADLRKVPYDREKFLAEFQDKGPEVLKPYWEQDVKSVRDEYSKQFAERDSQLRTLQTRMVVNERRMDIENYPDFRKLEPIIGEMLDDPNCPVDFSKPMDQVIDALYQLARQTSSADAIKQAEASGRKQAEANLVKESKATVTGGGKAASITTPDLGKMDMKQLREYFVNVNGVIDRD
jgi:hypothetical protein